MQRLSRHSTHDGSWLHRAVHQTMRTHNRFLANLNILRSNDRAVHPDICPILDHYLVMSLLPPVTGEIYTIRDSYILSNLNLVAAEIVQIATHTDKTAPPQFYIHTNDSNLHEDY